MASGKKFNTSMSSIFNTIYRQFWSTYSGYLYQGSSLKENPELISGLDVIVKPYQDVYCKHYSSLINIISAPSLEYLRIKLSRGDPYIALAFFDGDIAHVSFVAKTLSYSEYPILEKHSRAVGPCVTKKMFRGKNIYPTVLKYLRTSPLGIDGLEIFCNIDNVSSQKGIEKAGFVLRLQYREFIRLGVHFIRT
jgi:hypothetical protein